MTSKTTFYLDTNYLLYLAAFDQGDTKSEAVAANNFYVECKEKDISLVTSILGYEEAIHVNFYLQNLLKELKQHFKKMKNNPKEFGRKKFMRAYPGFYRKTYEDLAHIPEMFHRFLYDRSIKVLHPCSYKFKNLEIPTIQRYILCLIVNHNDLEPMDACHIAFARKLGLTTIVTSDKSFKNVKTIKTINFLEESI